MNTKMRRRLIAVSGVIIIVLIVILAVVGGNTAAKTVSVAEAADGNYTGQKVQVSGKVVPKSYVTEGNNLSFEIYDPDDTSAVISVDYQGSASSTFGNDVTAICTGYMQEGDVLQCSELVTKCPSKYESSTDALTVERLLGYGSDMIGTTVKVSGAVANDTLSPAGSDNRFVLLDPDSGDEIAVLYDGALSDDIQDGSTVVLTGSLDSDQHFVATNVALEG